MNSCNSIHLEDCYKASKHCISILQYLTGSIILADDNTKKDEAHRWVKLVKCIYSQMM